MQLADEYLTGAALAGETGSSLPEGYDGGSVSPPPRRRSLLS